MNNDTRCILFGGMAFLTGIMLGLGVSLLAAPQPGIRTRRQLRRLADDLGDHASNMADEAKQTVSDAVGRGKRILG